jgi:hypothetical protein
MSQGWCAKGMEREKVRRQRRNGNTFKPLMNRNSSTYAEKVQALKTYKALLRRDDASDNFVPVVIAPIYVGTGLPNEGYDFGETPVKSFKGPRVKSAAVVSAPSAPKVAQWSRRNGFAGK